jgi:hypothetical protein
MSNEEEYWPDDTSDYELPDLDEDMTVKPTGPPKDPYLDSVDTDSLDSHDLSDILGGIMQEGRRQAAQDGLGGSDDPTVAQEAPRPPQVIQDDVHGLPVELVQALAEGPSNRKFEEAQAAMGVLGELAEQLGQVDPETLADEAKKSAIEDLLEATKKAGARNTFVIDGEGEDGAIDPDFLSSLANALTTASAESGHDGQLMLTADGPDGRRIMGVRPVMLPQSLWELIDAETETHKYCRHEGDEPAVTEDESTEVPCAGSSTNFLIARCLSEAFTQVSVIHSTVMAADFLGHIEQELLRAFPEVDSGRRNLMAYLQTVQIISGLPRQISSTLASMLLLKYVQAAGKQPITPAALQEFDPAIDVVTDDIEPAIEALTNRIKDIMPGLVEHDDDHVEVIDNRVDEYDISHLDFDPEEDGE